MPNPHIILAGMALRLTRSTKLHSMSNLRPLISQGGNYQQVISLKKYKSKEESFIWFWLSSCQQN